MTQPPQSIEAVRRRARHRLMGASVLVLLGVLGFPLLFDTQPRPISVDIPIEIPAKSTAPALSQPNKSQQTPKPAAGDASKTPGPVSPAVSSTESLGEREEFLKSDAAAPLSDPRAGRADSSKPTTAKPVAPARAENVAPAPVKAVVPSDGARARALLDGKSVSESAGAERIIVQVGAFADVMRAREVRLKVESAGLKTYTHVAETPEGRRIRVRVGPFATRAEADQAAARIKAQGLPVAILTL